MELKTIIIDLLLKVTTLISCKDGRKTVGTGTGFFFRHQDRIFLVTNRHVFINERENFFPDKINIRLNLSESDIKRSTEISYDLYNVEKPLWKELSPQIDLVALEVPQPEGVILAAFTKDLLLPDDVALGLGEQVLVVGYPRGFYDEVNNLPIIRNGSIASAYGVNFRDEQIFLVDASLPPGTSGSPVITVPKNIEMKKNGGFSFGPTKWYFLGVNSGEFGGMQLNSIWYAHLIVQLLEKQ